MRKIILLGVVAMVALAVIGTLAMTRTAIGPSAYAPAAMNPFDMMKKTKNLPVRDIKDEAF